jgi:hypothetical protein
MVLRKDLYREARYWLVELGDDPSWVRDLSRRMLRRRVDVSFVPDGWSAFRRYARVIAGGDLVPDLSGASSQTPARIVVETDGHEGLVPDSAMELTAVGVQPQ